MTRSTKFKAGLAMAMASTTIGALQPVVLRYGAVRLDPLLYCAIATLAAGLFGMILLAARGELAPLFRRFYAPRLIVLSAFGSFFACLTLTYGLHYLGAIAAVLLLQIEPAYSLVMGGLFARERPGARQIAATAVIIAGIGSVLFSQSASFVPVWAAVLVMVTPLCWQTGHVISLRVMPPLSPACITAARYFYGGVALLLVLVMVNPRALGGLADPAAAAIVIFTGVVIYFCGSLAWYGAISRLSLSWTTAIAVPGVPLLSVLFALVFLGERATVREVIGIGLAAAGVLAMILLAPAERASEEPLKAAYERLL